MSALEKAGHDTSNPTVEMLNLVDQLYGGGVGGSIRYIANAFGCQIEAIDLTQEFVEAAVHLNKLCGIDDRISVNQGDVTDLSQEDQSFDLVAICSSCALETVLV
ncbi:MAG: class I SAM-dependent methyltransferase [Rhodospirillaceae bacterium]|nr:class I SAM-dependent methyltransferase [Rhodospirillaceae bacterium]MBT7955908.1 class I SAM-dependent methyltransferase [Rhodospirillaceae bacterium]